MSSFNYKKLLIFVIASFFAIVSILGLIAVSYNFICTPYLIAQKIAQQSLWKSIKFMVVTSGSKMESFCIISSFNNFLAGSIFTTITFILGIFCFYIYKKI
jgi:hypothetical protein